MATFSANNSKSEASLRQQTKQTNFKMCQPKDSRAVLQLNLLLETNDVLSIELSPDETDDIRSLLVSHVVSEVSDICVN